MQQLSSSPKFAVIGDPLPPRLSASIHLAVLRHYVPEASYERILVPKGELPQWLDRVRDEGYSGFNVSMPHELEIGRYLDELVMEADLTGSVNTVLNQTADSSVTPPTLWAFLQPSGNMGFPTGTSVSSFSVPEALPVPWPTAPYWTGPAGWRSWPAGPIEQGTWFLPSVPKTGMPPSPGVA